MKTNQIIFYALKKAKSGHFISFFYQKEGEDDKSLRVIRIGGDIEKRMEKQGTPINGKGSWMTGFSSGLRGCIVKKKGKKYVRGTEVSCNGETTGKHKIYCVAGMSELK